MKPHVDSQHLTNMGPIEIANAVLRVTFHEEVPVSIARLQCLLYLLEVKHRADTGWPLLGARFSAHAHGPRISSLDAQFASAGDTTLRRYAKNAEGRAWATYDLALTGRIYLVIAATQRTSTEDLIEQLRAEGTAWYSAWQSRQPYLDDEHIGPTPARARALEQSRLAREPRWRSA